MFAKANIDKDSLVLKNKVYAEDLFKYCFSNQELPKYIEPVRVVTTLDNLPSVSELDALYEKELVKLDRFIEGYVICYKKHDIQKYVRNKNGKIIPHKA